MHFNNAEWNSKTTGAELKLKQQNMIIIITLLNFMQKQNVLLV